jgi:uncharacterized membrane protein
MIRGKNVALAAAVAGLFALGAGHALADSHEGKGEKIKCEGVNGCKGKGSCHSAANTCAGKNGCKGKGFMMMTQAECDAARKNMEKKEEK